MMTMVMMMVMQVTLLEEWITDETTADEIAAFVEQFCSQLGPLASVCEVPSPLICFSEQCVMCPLTKGFVVLCCEGNKVGRQFFGQADDDQMMYIEERYVYDYLGFDRKLLARPAGPTGRGTSTLSG